MPRYRLLIEYDGTPFVGWQIQGVGVSVQGLLRDAVHKLTGEWVEVRGAGRTDAGVHALGQVAHLDCAKTVPDYVMRDALNAHLRPQPVAVLDATTVPDTFDARFSATARHYLYRLSNRRGQPALNKHRVWWVARPLDSAAMMEAAGVLVGHHDFTTFRSSSCQAMSPIKTLDRFAVRVTDDEIHIEASARSFMHHQVRSMVGSLKRVGEGAWSRADLRAALEATDRARCGAVAPACGLYFVKVDYGVSATQGTINGVTRDAMRTASIRD
jgi:tRNA pseudouridine38-40 synthase